MCFSSIQKTYFKLSDLHVDNKLGPIFFFIFFYIYFYYRPALI